MVLMTQYKGENKAEQKYKIYVGILKDIFKQCIDEGRRPLTMFEVVTLKNQDKIPNQYYHTSTLENTKTGEMSNATNKQIKKILKEKDLTIWQAWCVYVLSYGSYAIGNSYLISDDGRLVGVKE
jgi:hypothetical protein